MWKKGRTGAFDIDEIDVMRGRVDLFDNVYMERKGQWKSKVHTIAQKAIEYAT
jgi:hypothetical protein